MEYIEIEEPLYSQIVDGKKNIHIALNIGKISKLTSGNCIIWQNSEYKNKRTCTTKIMFKNVYSTFNNAINNVAGFSKIDSTANSIEEILLKFKGKSSNLENQYGVVLFHFEKL